MKRNGDRNQNKRTKLSWTEAIGCISVPGAVADREGKLKYRNRAAVMLLPSLSILREFLAQPSVRGGKTGLQSITLGNERYFLLSLPRREGMRAYLFLEDFLPFHDALSCELMRKTDSFLEKLEEKHLLQIPSEKRRELTDRVIAESCRLRRENGMLTRLLTLKQRTRSGEREAFCNVKGLFGQLSRYLNSLRREVRIECGENLVAASDPNVLLFPLLHALQFSFLCSDGRSSRILAEREKGLVRVTVSFPDEKGMMEVLSRFLLEGILDEQGVDFLGFSSLFCALLSMKKEGLSASFYSSAGQGKIVMLFPEADGDSALFLEASRSGKEQSFEELIREILF